MHNRYSSRVPSGENLAVDDEVRWLRGAGVEVVRHEVSNDDLVDPGLVAKLRSGAEAVWSRRARHGIESAIDSHRPELVHVHNLFPLLTASVVVGARRCGVPVVWTVHNRRVRCVAGGYFRDGRPCHDCRPGWRVPGVVHGCYSDSRLLSSVVTVGTSLFRTVAQRPGVEPVAISDAMASWLVDVAGFAPERVHVKYNGVAGPDRPAPPPASRRAFLFLGRLSAYKGVHLLLDAWRRADVDAELRIVGDGDLAGDVRSAASRDARIRWVGQVGPEAIGDHMAEARAVVVPSVWDEPFGRVAAEALAYGRPVVTTGRAGLGEVVDDSCGWSTGDDPDEMARAIRAAALDDGLVARMGRAATSRHEQRFSPEVTTRRLISIYESARSATTHHPPCRG